MVADTVVLSTRELMLPNQTPPKKLARRSGGRLQATKTGTLRDKNIFSGKGEIAPPFGQSKSNEPTQTPTRDPVLTRLPIVLGGTIVSNNEARSIATINLRSKNEIIPVKQGEIISNVGPARIEILKIERGKVIFRNLRNSALEYVELKVDEKINFGVAKRTTPSPQKTSGEVIADTETDFRISGDTIKKYTANLTNLLQQARAVPNIIPGSGGQVDGYRIVDIKKDSIFTKLGIKRMDVIKNVNGESINSPAKAMQMYNALKNSNEISIEVERGGSVETFNYTIE